MSKEHGPSLHIEWAPGRVQAIDITTRRRYAGATLSALLPLPAGQKTVLVGISRQLIFLKTVSLPKAAPEDLRRVLGIQMATLFPLPADQLSFDFVQTTEHMGDGYVTLVAAVRSEDLRLLNAELQQAGMHAPRILPVSLGAAAVAAHAKLPDALVVEAPATGGGYTFDVVSHGIVRLSRTSPEGADLTREAQRTLAAAGIDDVALLAAGDNEALRAATPLLPGVKTENSTSLDRLHEAPPFAFELTEERLREKKRRINQSVRVAVLLMVSAVLAVGLVWNDRSEKVAAVAAKTELGTKKLATLRALRDKELAAATAATNKDRTLKDAFVIPQSLSDAVAVSGDVMPASMWLTGLTVERGKPASIRGTSSDPDDIARYLKALTDTGRFRDVRLVVANTGRISESTVVEFNLTARAIGNLPMPKPEAKKFVPLKAPAPAVASE